MSNMFAHVARVALANTNFKCGDMPKNMPDCLKHRPVDAARKLPIPFINGEYEITFTSSERILQCIQEKLCSICGDPLNAEMVFIGEPPSVRNHIFESPPMHEGCAAAALKLCPHMTAVSDSVNMWIAAVTSGYEPHRQARGAIVYVARPFLRVSGWKNEPGKPGLVEIGDKELAAAVKTFG